MNNLKYKLAASGASAALMLSTMTAGVFAFDGVGDGYGIYGNGAFSSNHIYSSEHCESSVKQTNNTEVEVGVNAYSNTGGNSSSFNTGGSTTTDTGDATATSTTVVTVGSNTANAPDCCDCLSDGEGGVIEENGALSHNKVKVRRSSRTSVRQTNNTSVGVYANLKSNTGKNKSWFNTGGGFYDIFTGSANTGADTLVAAGENVVE